MATDQLTYYGTLIIEVCPTCSIRHGIPSDLRDRALADHSVRVTCPLGHGWWFTGKSDRQKLEEARAQLVHARDQLEAAQVAAEMARKQLIKDRYRWANGMCPCCRRNFPSLTQHVKTEHPDYDISAIKKPVHECSCGRIFETPKGLHIHQGHVRPDDWWKPGKSRWSAHLTVTK